MESLYTNKQKQDIDRLLIPNQLFKNYPTVFKLAQQD
jgi:hypothetical protein